MGTHPIFESDFDCLTECMIKMKEPVDAMFAASMRVSSAPTTHEKRARSASRQRPKMNGVFEIPDTSRSAKSTAKKSSRPKTTKSPRPAWSQLAPQPKFSEVPKKSSREKENFSKTRTISKNGGGSKGS